jgi:hypothetical protein
VTCELTLTDVTRMHEGRICIAGLDDNGRCVRPVVPKGNLWEEFLTSIRGSTIRPFSRLSVCLLDHEPDPPHTEDWTFNPWATAFIGQTDRSAAEAMLTRAADPCVAAIFGAPIHHDEGWYVRHGEGSRSLGTVIPHEITDVAVVLADERRVRVRIGFADAAGEAYRLSVTDLSLLRWCADQCRREGAPDPVADRLRRSLSRRMPFLRIGLARHWAKHPDRCHLQITGVY